jgi:hypothetical protein
MFSVAEAEALILDLAQPLVETELVRLEAAWNRVLAQTVVGQLDIPHPLHKCARKLVNLFGRKLRRYRAGHRGRCHGGPGRRLGVPHQGRRYPSEKQIAFHELQFFDFFRYGLFNIFVRPFAVILTGKFREFNGTAKLTNERSDLLFNWKINNSDDGDFFEVLRHGGGYDYCFLFL